MLSDYLEQQLEVENVTLAEFKELVVRLLNYGVLCRDENQAEQHLYDRYLRVADQVAQYLSLMDVRIYHDSRFEYIRLYPPGSRVPDFDGGEELQNSALRQRLSANEVAMVLILRVQYDKALREGRVDDHGHVTESLEALTIAMKNLLGRALPDKLTERKQLFRRLRQLRLIDFSQDVELENDESWLRIHPMIVTFVTDEALQSLSGGNLLDDEIVEEALDDVS